MNFLGGKSQENGHEEKDRKSNRTRKKNKRGDSKVESNDSPEISERGQTSDMPGLPSGGQTTAKSIKWGKQWQGVLSGTNSSQVYHVGQTVLIQGVSS